MKLILSDDRDALAPFVLLLTGPAGAGKTTVADAWARIQQHTTAHLSLDAMRRAVKSGYTDPSDGWSDDAIFPQWQAVGYEGWVRDLGDLPHALVVLLPSWEVVVERNQHDDHPLASRLPECMLRTIYEDMHPWRDLDLPVIDTTDLSVVNTVRAIDTALNRSR